MLDPQQFLDRLTARGIDSFFGVPDSLLKSLNSKIAGSSAIRNHVVCANEGAAVGSAVGHFIGTGSFAAVYLQNSGLGNTINPLLSIADPSVYAVPMLMLIGWRGEPGEEDEPQHVRQGELTPKLLDQLGVINRSILRHDHSDWREKVDFLIDHAQKKRTPVALLIGKDTFAPSTTSHESPEPTDRLQRESALNIVLEAVPKDDFIVATTGMLGRELYELREGTKNPLRDFLNIGGMGHTSAIAMGLGLARTEKSIWCLDGDGSAIMHLGSLAVIAAEKPRNFKHVIFNNRAHDSVGGQPTAAGFFSFARVAATLGYSNAVSATTEKEISAGLEIIKRESGPSLLEINIRKGARADLGRPRESPRVMIDDLMKTASVKIFD